MLRLRVCRGTSRSRAETVASAPHHRRLLSRLYGAEKDPVRRDFRLFGQQAATLFAPRTGLGRRGLLIYSLSRKRSRLILHGRTRENRLAAGAIDGVKKADRRRAIPPSCNGGGPGKKVSGRGSSARGAGTEAHIAIFKHSFVGNPSRAKGLAARTLSVGWVVLAHNLWVLAELKLKQERAAAEAAHAARQILGFFKTAVFGMSSNLCFGGSRYGPIFATCAERLYKRKLNATGTDTGSARWNQRSRGCRRLDLGNQSMPSFLLSECLGSSRNQAAAGSWFNGLLFDARTKIFYRRKLLTINIK